MAATDGTKVPDLDYPTEAERANLLLYAWDRTAPLSQFKVPIEDLGAFSGGSSSAREWDFNFTAAGEAVIRSRIARTISQAATTGTGTVAYEKSTTASPDTFASATAPVTLEAGAKLRVSVTDVTGTFTVHLESD